MIMVPTAATTQVATNTAPLRHAGIAQDDRIDEDDVGHGHEGRDAGEYLGPYVGSVFFQGESSFKHVRQDLFWARAPGLPTERSGSARGRRDVGERRRRIPGAGMRRAELPAPMLALGISFSSTAR